MELKDLTAVLALLVAVVALIYSKAQWRQSNRPLVTAFVEEHATGNMAATFNLIVANSGNRPAINVTLHAEPDEIQKLFGPSTSSKNRALVQSNFEEGAIIPLLRNGEKLETSFGAMKAPESDHPWLAYGETIEITISYEDLDRKRKYYSKIPLKIYARHGFGGGIWS